MFGLQNLNMFILEACMYTINEVGMVAAFPQLHHGVEEVGDAGSSAAATTSSSSTSFGQEGEILLQNGPIVFLLDVGQFHLTTTIIDPFNFIPLLKKVTISNTSQHAAM